MFKVLVIEDTSEEMQRIKKIIDNTPEIEGFYAKDLAEARPYLGLNPAIHGSTIVAEPEVDGVLSDVIFPLAAKEHLNRVEREQGHGEPNEPIGIGIIMLCQKQNIPCVLCSSLHHHGGRLEWATITLRCLELPDICDEPFRADDEKIAPKPWGKALRQLIRLLS